MKMNSQPVSGVTFDGHCHMLTQFSTRSKEMCVLSWINYNPPARTEGRRAPERKLTGFTTYGDGNNAFHDQISEDLRHVVTVLLREKGILAAIANFTGYVRWDWTLDERSVDGAGAGFSTSYIVFRVYVTVVNEGQKKNERYTAYVPAFLHYRYPCGLRPRNFDLEGLVERNGNPVLYDEWPAVDPDKNT